jgi:hypothetical protein
MILLVSGIAGSVAASLSDGSSLGKYVKYISALVCVVIVISPLSTVIKSITLPLSEPAETTFSEETLTETAIKMTEKQLSEKIYEKFGIIPTGVRIEIDRDEKVSVFVSLKAEDEVHREEIESYILRDF